ncbi:ATP-dependent rRNA helicase spb4 [Gurleya vavrai]
MKNELTFLNYLKLKNIELIQNDFSVVKYEFDYIFKLLNKNLKDLSLIAFVSYIRSYKEYCLGYIFNLKEIDFDSAIALHFLEKVPNMRELQNVKFERFKRKKKDDKKGKKSIKLHKF